MQHLFRRTWRSLHQCGLDHTDRLGAGPPDAADTPRHDVVVGVTGRTVTVFSQVTLPHVDKVLRVEVGHRPLVGGAATIG